MPHLSRGSKGGIPQPAPRWDFGVHRCRTHVSQSARLCSNGAEGRLCPGTAHSSQKRAWVGHRAISKPSLIDGCPTFHGVRKVDFHNPPLVGISVSTDAVPLSPKARDACPELAEGHPGGGDTNPAKKSPRVILQTGPCWHINFCVLFCADGWPIQARFWA